MWLGLIALSLLSILILNFASDVIPGKGFDSTGSYLILGLFSFGVMWWLRTPTTAYFALPKLRWSLLLAIVFMVNFIAVQIRNEDFSGVESSKWVRGVIFLIAIAVAEEIFSRGIVFGVLQRHGLTVAVIGSSLMFGLMHINSYVGNFDAWPAYWHVVSAASFGVFACALMVVTGSIWMPIALHTFANAGLLLDVDLLPLRQGSLLAASRASAASSRSSLLETERQVGFELVSSAHVFKVRTVCAGSAARV